MSEVFPSNIAASEAFQRELELLHESIRLERKMRIGLRQLVPLRRKCKRHRRIR